MSTQTIEVNEGRQSSLVLNIALWLVQIGAAAMFLFAGYHKLSGDPQMIGLFDAIGIGQWFRYLTGGLEFIGGVLLLIPAFSGVAGLLLTAVMIGAVATHLFIVGGSPAFAVVLLAASLFVAWGRRERTFALIGR